MRPDRTSRVPRISVPEPSSVSEAPIHEPNPEPVIAPVVSFEYATGWLSKNTTYLHVATGSRRTSETERGIYVYSAVVEQGIVIGCNDSTNLNSRSQGIRIRRSGGW